MGSSTKRLTICSARIVLRGQRERRSDYSRSSSSLSSRMALHEINGAGFVYDAVVDVASGPDVCNHYSDPSCSTRIKPIDGFNENVRVNSSSQNFVVRVADVKGVSEVTAVVPQPKAK